MEARAYFYPLDKVHMKIAFRPSASEEDKLAAFNTCLFVNFHLFPTYFLFRDVTSIFSFHIVTHLSK